MYTNAIINGKKVALIGRYPPPWGGISVHVQRVIAQLRAQNNKVYFFEAAQQIRYVFFFFYAVRLLYFLIRHRPDILFYHTLYLKHAFHELWLIVLLKRMLCYRVVIVDHHCRYLYNQSEKHKNYLNKLMHHVDQQLFIGNLTEQSYRDNGIIKPPYWSVESAFLPPDENQRQTIIGSYPPSLFDFIHNHTPLLLMNGSRVSLLPNGKDLYGFDMSLQVIMHSKSSFAKIGLIIALPEIANEFYYEEILTFIRNNHLDAHVYFFHGQKELWPLFTSVDLFLRPTWTDGDSISVREALYYNVPVVASDICIRPEHVTLFKTGDVDDCLKKVLSVLSRYEKNNVGFSHLYPKSP